MSGYDLRGKRVWVAGHRGMVGSAIVRALAPMDCEVLTVEPMQRLAYTWNYEHADQAYHLESTVTFTLTPTATGTHLRMEQTGFRSDQKQALGGAVHGWNGMFAKLEEVLAGLD